MMRRRLFWKLFLAFWLANTLTFLVGAGAFMLNELRGDTPGLRSLLATELQLLERHGERAGRQLLDVSPQPQDVQVGLYDDQGRLLAKRCTWRVSSRHCSTVTAARWCCALRWPPVSVWHRAHATLARL